MLSAEILVYFLARSAVEGRTAAAVIFAAAVTVLAAVTVRRIRKAQRPPPLPGRGPPGRYRLVAVVPGGRGGLFGDVGVPGVFPRLQCVPRGPARQAQVNELVPGQAVRQVARALPVRRPPQRGHPD